MSDFARRKSRTEVPGSYEERIEIIRLSGDIDMSTVDTMERLLLGAVDAAVGSVPVVADCSGVTFLGSCGLRMLLSAHHIAQSRNTPLHIVAPQRAVRRPVRLTGLDQTLQLYNSVQDAVRAPEPYETP
jgi:anti-anti-sigma factor